MAPNPNQRAKVELVPWGDALPRYDSPHRYVATAGNGRVIESSQRYARRDVARNAARRQYPNATISTRIV